MTTLVEVAGAWWRDNVEGPLFGHRRVTLTSGTVVKLDEEGRILAGGPAEWIGAHVRDVPTLARKLRELQGEDCDAAALDCSHGCGATFKTKSAGVAALLEANPRLAAFLQDEGGQDSRRFREWNRGGRRGKKPELQDGDGRFDALNERLELHGARRCSSWLEAVHVTVPPSRKWDDFPERIAVLEEATGLDLRLPSSAEKRQLGRASAEECRRRIDEAIGELLKSAKSTRLADVPTETEVPF